MALADRIKEWYHFDVRTHKFNYISDKDPTIDVNPEKTNVIWFNKKRGVIWICIDNTPNKNKWKGTNGEIIGPTTIHKVDIFDDGSCLGLWTFDGHLHDLGGRYDAVSTNDRYTTFDDGKIGQSLRSYFNRYQVRITIPDLSKNNIVTVSAWIKWDGVHFTMPFGFKSYDLYLCFRDFGFNTARGDVYGIRDFTRYREQWIHVVAEFHNDDVHNNKLWIDGHLQTLYQTRGRPVKNPTITDTFYVFGWGNSSGYRWFGCVDQLRIFNRALTNEEVLILKAEGKQGV